MSTILVTGSFGNVGFYVVKKLLERNYQVVAFDRKVKKTEKTSRKVRNEVRIHWGDITDKESLRKLRVEDMDGVIHLSFIIPPLSEKNPEIAEKVNVEGTRSLIRLLTDKEFQGPLVFASSASVFGKTAHEAPPITVGHPVEATDTYTQHKITCENMVRESGLDWRILRYSVVMIPAQQASMDEMKVVLSIPLTNRVEPVHVEDVATATVGALAAKRASRRVLIVAGGPRNQLYWSDYISTLLEPYIGKVTREDLSKGRFSTTPYYLDWYDTADSQEILQYQHHTVETYVRDSYEALGMKGAVFRLIKPITRWKILAELRKGSDI